MSATRYQLLHFLANTAFKEGDFVLRSGVRSQYYLSKVDLFTKPELLHLAAKMMVEHMISTDDAYVKHIIAPETGGAMFATAMQQILLADHHSRMSLHVYRKDGTITGIKNPLSNYIIVEDVITSGKTVLNLIDCLKEHSSWSPGQVIALVDRGGEGVDKLRKIGIQVSTLFEWKELLAVNGRYQSDPAQEPGQG
jgi:orotate phosphoribosyltransferase